MVFLILSRWIVIYPVDSAIQLLNNWSQPNIYILPKLECLLRLTCITIFIFKISGGSVIPNPQTLTLLTFRFSQPRTQASSRNPSDQRRLGTKREFPDKLNK